MAEFTQREIELSSPYANVEITQKLMAVITPAQDNQYKASVAHLGIRGDGSGNTPEEAAEDLGLALTAAFLLLDTAQDGLSADHRADYDMMSNYMQFISETVQRV